MHHLASGPLLVGNSSENFHVLHLLLPKLIVIENGVYSNRTSRGSLVENRGVETGCNKGVCKRDWCTSKYVSL